MPVTGAVRVAAASLTGALGQRDIRFVQASWALSITADTAFMVVGLIVAYQVAGPLGVGLLAAARTLPATAVVLVVHVTQAGRVERLLRLSHLGQAAGAAVATIAIALEWHPGLVFAGVAAAAAAGSLVRPGQLVLFPGLAARPDQLLGANVAMSLGEGAGSFVGPLLAGLIAAIVGPVAAAAGAAILFLLAATVLLPVRQPDASRLAPEERPHQLPVVSGLQILRAHPAAGVVVASFLAQVLVRGALTTLVVLLAIEILGAGEQGVGSLNAAIGLGGLLGAVISLALGGQSRLAPAFALALVLWGVPLILIGLVPSLVVGLLALGTVGLANAVLDVAGFTLLQRGVPRTARGPVFAVLESGVGIGIAAGGIGASLLAVLIGVGPTLVLAGTLLPVVAIAGWRLVRVLDEHAVPHRRAALLRGVPLFTLLPLDGLERLAGAMEPAHFESGDNLMTQGEPGDRYLVIERGTAIVTQNGRELRQLGPGEGLGEIALLRSVPRTATVTAGEHVDAWSIDAHAFRAAVTGHEPSVHAADTVVEDRLRADADDARPPGSREAADGATEPQDPASPGRPQVSEDA
jgi:hypothetical protein